MTSISYFFNRLTVGNLDLFLLIYKPAGPLTRCNSSIIIFSLGLNHNLKSNNHMYMWEFISYYRCGIRDCGSPSFEAFSSTCLFLMNQKPPQKLTTFCFSMMPYQRLCKVPQNLKFICRTLLLNINLAILQVQLN